MIWNQRIECITREHWKSNINSSHKKCTEHISNKKPDMRLIVREKYFERFLIKVHCYNNIRRKYDVTIVTASSQQESSLRGAKPFSSLRGAKPFSSLRGAKRRSNPYLTHKSFSPYNTLCLIIFFSTSMELSQTLPLESQILLFTP